MKIRLEYLLAVIATLTVGLLSRAVHTGVSLLDKSLGDLLYATLIYFGLSLLVPRVQRLRRAIGALLFCFAIEAFKLTGLPHAWVSHRLSRLVFGSTPSIQNLFCYTMGVAAAWGIDAAWRRRLLRKQ